MTLIERRRLRHRGRLTAAIVTLNENVRELEELADSAGYDVKYEIIQRKNHPDTATYVGRGKLEQIKELLEESPVEAVLINDEIKPSQHFNMENKLKSECIDRVRLVLNIFARKADDKLARLQVEKAKLQYEMPLLREWIHNAKRGEHPGFLSGGEYRIDVYYDLISKRMKKINDELDKIGDQREVRRRQRKEKGFHLVSLAGYTNAGKSSLLNELTGENVSIDEKMFSTLSTTTRKLEETNKDILITDTIGFLHDLPHFLIESFRTVIEEIFLADMILLVVDASDPGEELIRKMETSFEILLPVMDSDQIIVVLNKIDRIDGGVDSELQLKVNLIEEKFSVGEILPVSVKEEENIDMLNDMILSSFHYPYRIDFSAPNLPQVCSLISWLYDKTEVNEVNYENEVEVSVNCRESHFEKIKKKVSDISGTVVVAGKEDQLEA